MSTLRESVIRLWATLRGTRTDRDLEEELRLHLELASENAQRSGSPEPHVRAATIRAGGVAQAMEALRDQRGLPWLHDLVSDLRYGCRMLAKNPGFTLVAVLSLAIGIGANTAVFSFADTLLLRPLTVPRPGEVLTVGSTSASTIRPILLASYRDYVDVRDRSQSFEGLVAFTDTVVGFATQPDTLPKLTIGMLVTGNFFPVMGVEPELGRAFRLDEDQVPGQSAVVMLGHDFWRREFGADRSVIGRAIRLNGTEFTVIGVTPARFTGMDQYVRYAFFAPLMMWPRLVPTPKASPFEARDLRSLDIRGRLKRGVTMAQANTELSVIATDLERAYPDTNRNQTITARTELQARIASAPPVARLLVMLNLLAAAVLFVACANVAGLLASRAPVRAREIALRLAIGAGRPRILRQLITESMLIALIGGGLGLGVGYAGVTMFRQFRIPTDLPIVASFDLDRRVLLASLVVALVSAILFGLGPAIRSTRADLTAVMKATDAAGFGRRRWGRALLVGGQVAVSVVLLVVATFIYRGFQQQLANGPGFRTDHLLMMSVAPTREHYSESLAQRFFERMADGARQVPGVQSATLTRYMPMDGLPPSVTIIPEGFAFPAGKDSATVAGSIVDEGYFETVGLPILHGRGFHATDAAGAPKVAIVNEVVAQRFWPGQDPIGKRFRLDNREGPWVEIVGVAKTSKYSVIIERPLEFVYLPYRQRAADSMFLLVRSLGDPASLAAPLREVVRGLDANLPISNTRTMEELYRLRSVVILNVIVSLIASMGMMGLALALVGLYGLVAYAASRRTKEIGVRMAIGAGRADVVRMVLRQGLVLAIVGLGTGLLASAGVARAMGTIFPGGLRSDGTDYVAFPLVACGVLVVTLLAAYLPARRASRVNPTDALRHE
jgi:macrolide transport system ATP-binding/permease protein